MPHRVVSLSLLFAASCLLSCARRPEPRFVASHPLPHAVNINTAPPVELQKIPHVGESLALKIVRYREINGPFRRIEHLMLIQGISDKRFRKIRPLVSVE